MTCKLMQGMKLCYVDTPQGTHNVHFPPPPFLKFFFFFLSFSCYISVSFCAGRSGKAVSEKRLSQWFETVHCTFQPAHFRPHRRDLILLGILWMPSSESRRCLCQLQWDWWKVALEAEIPANWQRGCGLAPLFTLILEWSVCLSGWYTGPGINELLVTTAIRWRYKD